MKNSNIGNVIRFEIVRNLKKPTFWIASLLLPIILVAYIGLISFIGMSGEESMSEGTDTSEMSLGVYDEAEYLTTTTVINPDEEYQELTVYDSKEQGIDDVKSGELDVFYVVPADFAENLSVETYARPDSASIFNNYDAPIHALLTASATSRVDVEDIAVLTNSVSINTTNFSAETDEEVDINKIISNMVIPGVGAALFFILVMMFGNRLTTAMVEEKEYRISEIILTSIKPSDLIIGKIVSLIALGLIQLLVLIIPMLLMYVFGSTQNIIPPDFVISLDPYLIISTVLLVVLSYFLFSAMCIVIGTLVPTAKDAASFSSVLMIMFILPLMFITSFMSETPSLIVYIMSYFPPSAPLALLFRSAFGTLPIWELIIGLANLALFSFLSIQFAVYVFKRTAIEFTSKINLSLLLKNTKKNH